MKRAVEPHCRNDRVVPLTCSSHARHVSSVFSRALAEGHHLVGEVPALVSAGRIDSLDVAFRLAQPESSRYSRTLTQACAPSLRHATTAATARITQVTTASAMRLMQQLLLAVGA